MVVGHDRRIRAEARACRRTGREENEFAWKVSAEDVAANGFNLDIKNPHTADTGPGDPDELLQEFARVNAEAASVLDELKQELATVLAPKR